jgi:hypothetical protein
VKANVEIINVASAYRILLKHEMVWLLMFFSLKREN